MLWNAGPGTKMGPKIRGLRRLPIRKDLYQEPFLTDMVDAVVMPYEVASEFIYDYDLTGRHFTPLRNIIRAMCIDSHEEMKAAWAALTASRSISVCSKSSVIAAERARLASATLF